MIRGDGKDQFKQIINKQISLLPPSKNLEISNKDNYIFAKNSIDQWSLLYTKEQDYNKVLKFVADLNLMMKYLLPTIRMDRFISRSQVKTKIYF